MPEVTQTVEQYHEMAARDPLVLAIGTPDDKIASVTRGIDALMKQRREMELGGSVFYEVEPEPVYKPNAVYCSRGKWFGPPHEGQCNGEPTRNCDAWAGPR